MFNATSSNGNISKCKKIFWTFFWISRIYIKFGILWKKIWTTGIIFFWNYRLEKAGLRKYLKCKVSEHLWTFNMLKGRRHRKETLWKEISSKNCVLAESKIRSLFLNIWRVFSPNEEYSLQLKASDYCNQFKCNYLQI